ncbi:MAG: hydroxymethylbilane synthase [Dethiobacter sp.]|jgi:hydroxymethylbilane synthase|nr:MAG: hydroxymethylbilane synthase [Dethiobacter sp.]
MKRVVVGTRGSRLAMHQAEHVISLLQKIAPHREFVLQKIRTRGDLISEVPLAKVEGKGFFVKEIEQALLEGKIDLAVHSMKDVPTFIPEGLKMGAILQREDPRDVLICRGDNKLHELPPGAAVATGSLRRIAQLKHFRPDLVFLSLRGNVDTRMRKLFEEDFSALILAFAGVRRMGWLEHVSEVIPTGVCLPAAGQGALGVEIREGDREIEEMVSRLDHGPTRISLEAERAFLREVEGGCQVPVGVLGETMGDRVFLQGVICSMDGRDLLRGERSGSVVSAGEMGVNLARDLISRGGAAILEQVRREFNIHEEQE